MWLWIACLLALFTVILFYAWTIYYFNNNYKYDNARLLSEVPVPFGPSYPIPPQTTHHPHRDVLVLPRALLSLPQVAIASTSPPAPSSLAGMSPSSSMASRYGWSAASSIIVRIVCIAGTSGTDCSTAA